ncbi:MAG: hypothetical protein MJ093_06580 [Saccharofermentans sp.]|nr:hypothetical protein [Saccharofermentans sp.]
MKYSPEQERGIFRDRGLQISVVDFYRKTEQRLRDAGKPLTYGIVSGTPSAIGAIIFSIVCLFSIVIFKDVIGSMMGMSGFVLGLAIMYFMNSYSESMDTGTRNKYRINSLLFMALSGVPFVYSVLGRFGIVKFNSDFAMTMVGIILVVVAVWLLYQSFLSTIVRRALYDGREMATCIGYVDRLVRKSRRNHRGSREYMVTIPIYEFNYMSQTYQVYGHRAERYDDKLPYVGSRTEARFSTRDPYNCIVGYKFKIQIMLVITAIIAGFFALICFGAFPNNNDTPTQVEIEVPAQYTDDYFAEYIGMHRSQAEDQYNFVVYKLDIIERESGSEADNIIFENIPGIAKSYMDFENKFDDCDYVYYVKPEGQEECIFPGDRDYIGTRSVEGTDIATAEGQYYIDDAFIDSCFKYHDDNWKMTKATIYEVGDRTFSYQVKDAGFTVTLSPANHTKMYDDMEVGDEIYLIESSNHMEYLPLKHYQYKGYSLK